MAFTGEDELDSGIVDLQSICAVIRLQYAIIEEITPTDVTLP